MWCSSNCRPSARRLTKGGEAAVVESVKAASEVYAPVTGEVVDVNKELEGDPGPGQPRRRRRWLVHEGEDRQSSRARRADGQGRLRQICCKSLRSSLMSRASLAELEPGANFIRRHIGPSDTETADMLQCSRRQVARGFHRQGGAGGNPHRRGRSICQRPRPSAPRSPICARWPTATRCSPR